MMSVSAYLTVLAPESAWIGFGNANIAAQVKRRVASTAKRARESGGEILAGRDREIRLRPSLTALLPVSVPLRFRGDRYRNRSAFGSSFLSRQDLKAPFEAVLLESLGPLSVVKGIVG